MAATSPGAEKTAVSPKVVILDLTSGRVRGGHSIDDLERLEDALAPFKPERLSPYKDKASAKSKMGRFRLLASALRGLRREKGNIVLVVETASRIELLQLVQLSLLYGRTIHLLMALRRESYGHGIQKYIFRELFSFLIRSKRWTLACYSKLVLDFWQKQTGRAGWLLAFPKRRMPEGWKKVHPDEVTFSFLGALRWDKGAAYYDGLVEKCLAVAPDSRVVLHFYTQYEAINPDAGLEAISRSLREHWSGRDRVQMVDHDLTYEAYAALVAETDVGLFLYDVALYGGGDSGVLHEILTAGKVAVATPIAWAKAVFAGHPNLVFVDDPGGDAVAAALGDAYRRAKAMPAGGDQASAQQDLFGQSWYGAVSNAMSVQSESGSAGD